MCEGMFGESSFVSIFNLYQKCITLVEKWCTMNVLTLLCVAVILRLIYYVMRRRKMFKGLKDFISPPGSLIFRHVSVFKKKDEILPKLLNLTNTYGGLLVLEMMVGLPFMIVSDKDFLKLLLGTTTIMNKDRVYEHVRHWLGTGLLTSEKEKWEKTRKIITPAFHVKVLERYIENIHSPVAILMDQLNNEVGDQCFNIFPYITLCTLDVICETAMGTKIYAQERKESTYVKSVKEMCRIVQDRSNSIWKFFDTLFIFSEDYRLERKALQVLHGFTNDVITKKKAAHLTRTTEIQDRKKLSFLDLITEAKIDGRPMTDDEIRQEVDTFMFAGHDTTASGTSFTLYCLSTYPEVQRKVVDELQSIFGDDDRNPTYQDIQDMHYLDLVIKEALRLFPPVPMYVRSAKVDTKLGDYIIPKKLSVCVFAYGLHRNPKYFPEPDKFKPERFEDDIEPYTYLPFSTGPRSCIGKKFAVFEMKCIISAILRRFEILPAPGFKPILVTNIVLGSANGVQVILKKKR